MLNRRAEEAGYGRSVLTSSATFSSPSWQGGGSEGDLMRWSDRSMLDRHAEDLQVERVIAAKRKHGNIY